MFIGRIMERMVQLARLKLVRLRKALTQQQLAEKAQVNRVTIARLEGGMDRPFPTTVRKLADALGVQPEDLMESGSASIGRIEGSGTAEVDRLLHKHPELKPILDEAANELTILSPDARLTLAALPDPEYGDAQQLFLGVSTDLPDDQAIEALRRFDQEWWVHHAGRTRGLLVIDLSDE
jgi:transcriptional regulator with XRE-family HTH domain